MAVAGLSPFASVLLKVRYREDKVVVAVKAT